jgi:thiol-disulfide isomerase/thioredoxin
MKLHLMAALTFASVFVNANNASAADFGIGSKAPALDIEHWVTEQPACNRVTDLKPGTVYVVEFWATWCGPCIASMPHLAEIQQKYRDKGVQIISISDEDLQTVEGFLEQEGPEKKTFKEITSAYCLTTDPDGSVKEDYFTAAGQSGIPSAFIVGKTGLVEWIGHPMSMDDPDNGDVLTKVVEGTWDREEFKMQLEEQTRLEGIMQQVAKLAQQGKFKEAVQMIEEQLKDAKSPFVKEHLELNLYNLKLSGGMLDEKVTNYFKDRLTKSDDLMEIGQASYLVVLALENGADVGELSTDSINALKKVIDKAPDELKPSIYNQIAQLYKSTKQNTLAIEAQQKAVELSTGREQQRMKMFLDELKKEAANPSDSKPKEVSK